MIKSELVRKLAEYDPHLSRHDFETIVDVILHAIRDGLARGDRVELRGFGTFALRKHAARMGCNPRTKDPVSVSEKVVPAFKAAKEMHQRLNPISRRPRDKMERGIELLLTLPVRRAKSLLHPSSQRASPSLTTMGSPVCSSNELPA